MTKEEFCKKHCYNGHDPSNCHMMKDLEELIASERANALYSLGQGLNRDESRHKLSCFCIECLRDHDL